MAVNFSAGIARVFRNLFVDSPPGTMFKVMLRDSGGAYVCGAAAMVDDSNVVRIVDEDTRAPCYVSLGAVASVCVLGTPWAPQEASCTRKTKTC